MFRTCMLQLCGVALLLIAASVAHSQSPYSFSPYNSNAASGSLYPNQIALKNAQAIMLNSQQQQQSTGMSGAGRIGLGIGDSLSGAKPFSNYSPGPTVSPYLNLFRVDLGNGSNFNYSTLVEPQLRQQQFQQQQQRQNQQTSRRLQSIAAEAAFNPQGSKEINPTGHQTVFNYLGTYFPTPRQHQKKRAQQQQQ